MQRLHADVDEDAVASDQQAGGQQPGTRAVLVHVCMKIGPVYGYNRAAAVACCISLTLTGATGRAPLRLLDPWSAVNLI